MSKTRLEYHEIRQVFEDHGFRENHDKVVAKLADMAWLASEEAYNQGKHDAHIETPLDGLHGNFPGL
jgi:hypothetical protein